MSKRATLASLFLLFTTTAQGHELTTAHVHTEAGVLALALVLISGALLALRHKMKA